MLRPFLVLLLGLATVSSTITQWTKIGEVATMACPMPDEGEEIHGCSWKNGIDGKFKSNFKKTHGDRIGIEKIENDTLCTILFDTVEEEDEGTWGCQIRYENKDGETIDMEAERILNVANFSDENPTLEDFIVDENTTETNFICKFESKPLPTFSWYIDDEKLADSTEYATELSENKMSQTLNYGKPREGHSNKTLKCVVDFEEYGLKDTFQESLEFDFPENVVLVPKRLDAKPEEKLKKKMSALEKNPALLGLVILACGLVVCLFMCVVCRNGCDPCCLPNEATKSDDTDAETGTSDSLPMKESTDTEKTDDNETEKADSTKDEKEKIPEVVAPRNFGDRLASFFRINKSFTMEDEKLDEEKDTDESEEVPEVVVDGTGEKKEANGELDKSDCNGHNKTDETVELGAKKASGGSRIMAFFGKMFKPRSDVVADESTTEDQTVVKIDDEGLEQTVVEETTPLAKEAELEDRYIILDKPEPVEEDDNKKEPTPNTSF